ncbi:MAG: acyl-CoA dehydrogenase family protein [Bacteriovoracaceae bacterium]|nr:acyl-CoA dehydrogenase family protein [Bacteriovoracaceae bacterium]
MTGIFESVVGNFFYGRIDEEAVFPYPKLNEEQKEMAKDMVNAVSKYCTEAIDSEKLDQDGEITKEMVAQLAEMGLCGLAVKEEFGGMELDYTLYARVMGEMGYFDASIATMLGAHQSIGYRALINVGTKEQKEKWLPRLATGEALAAFCLTEPGAGSDAYSIKTKAVKNDDGTYTINGQKLWITNAGMAEFYTVFCKTEILIDGKPKERISCFVVEKGTQGLSFGEKEKKLGIRASETRAVFLDNVVVPSENLLGEPGKGFNIAMEVLNTGRLSLATACVGGMNRFIKEAAIQVKGRKQFGKSISEFGMVQRKIADMAALCYTAESAVYLTTGSILRGLKDYQLESAICKIMASEYVWKIIDECFQLAAGNAYMQEYPYERWMRDARINKIFEGTNEILRCFIALTGIQGPADDLKELGKMADVNAALQDPIKSLGLISKFAKSRLSKMVPTRSLTKCHPDLEKYTAYFSTMLGSFSIQVENTLIKYGKKIIDNEFPQERIANMVIELYGMISVLSRTTSLLEDDSVSQQKKQYILDITKIACKQSRQRFYSNLKTMVKNNDRLIKKVSEVIVENEGLGIDIIDF